ncbi:MAG: hypothetical protein HY289_07470 [Planctomycetes bacterium]|nr:hypothetical protein [Planctomycetota bacterium]
MKFAEQPPSKHWAALKFRGEKFAEVWFKPEGEPRGVTFRIPQQSFQIPGMAEQLTIANLLRAVAIVPDEVESWRHGDAAPSGMHGALPPPPQHVSHLEIHVRLKQPSAGVARIENGESEISSAKWQDLENRWKAILGLEAGVETWRISMESLLVEMESLWKKPLTIEEKTYAPRADVAQWNKAKNRVHNALPKMKEFIHRSVWAIGSPERKRLEELYNDHIQPHIPFPQIDEVLKQLEELRKDRQVLSAHGKTVYQECRGIATELQGTLRTLQTNTANAQKKKGATGSKGRHF